MSFRLAFGLSFQAEVLNLSLSLIIGAKGGPLMSKIGVGRGGLGTGAFADGSLAKIG